MTPAFSERDARELKRHLIPVVQKLQNCPLDRDELLVLVLELRPALQLAHLRLEQSMGPGRRAY